MIRINGYVQLSKLTNGERWEHRSVYVEHHGAIPKGMEIHHVNGIKNDNRIDNLRLVTRGENMRHNDMIGKGYTYKKDSPNNPYESRRTVNGIQKVIGYFGTACGAIMANRMAYVTHG